MEVDVQDEPPGRDGVEVFHGMELPPLVSQLKAILDQYPNNGQIIKELIQNAEDAGATNMKILWDKRTKSWDMLTEKHPYNKFFACPALCFYNDAVFTDDDWDGILKIQGSNKEMDPLKVGRFGLGFKSVFHLTDHPCIISGNKLLIINSKETDSKKVGIEISLKRLRECRRLDFNCFMTAMNKTFGLTEKVLEEGIYKGTLLWFTLRKEQWELSSALYDGTEIETLMTRFRSEGLSTLIFLSNLSRLSVFQRSTGQSLEETFSVSIDGHDSTELQQNRERFVTEVKNTKGRYIAKSISSVHFATFKTKLCQSQKMKEEKWLVLKLYKGGEMTAEFKEMIEDKTLAYSPSVGIATRLNSSLPNVSGHIFCFLPLPQPGPDEPTNQTHLPVHINGFFALTQNRAQLKWPTPDQTASDMTMEWNRCLLREAVPEAYCLLIKELISHSIEKGNTPDLIKSVYNCIPNVEIVNGKWKEMVTELLQLLDDVEIVFTESNGGQWIKTSEAIFTSFEDNAVSKEVQHTIKNVLTLYNTHFADVPNHVFCLARKRKCTMVSPECFARLLNSEHSTYDLLTKDEKLYILQYILYSNKTESHSINISDLKLLPLATGEFEWFCGIEPVFLAGTREVELFPDLKGKFVNMDTLPTDLRDTFRTMCHHGDYLEDGDGVSSAKKVKLDTYRIRTFDERSMIKLLDVTITNTFSNTGSFQNISEADLPWFQEVLMYFIEQQYCLKKLKKLPILPVHAFSQGRWEVCRPDRNIVMREMDGLSLPDGVTRALECMTILVIDKLPERLQYNDFKDFIFKPQCILQLMSSLTPSVVMEFNTTCDIEDARAFATFLGKSNSLDVMGDDAKRLLKGMQLFPIDLSSRTLTSVDKLNRGIVHFKFPVKYPRPLILCYTEPEQELAKALGVCFDHRDCIILETLKVLCRRNCKYTNEDKELFMKWFLQNVLHEATEEIVEVAKDVTFLKAPGRNKKACDLFHPNEREAEELLFEEELFPDKEYSVEPFLSGLTKIGLRSIKRLGNADLLRIGQKLDAMHFSRRHDDKVRNKATAFMKVLEECSSNLDETTRLELSKCHCILVKHTKDQRYPEWLSWFGHTMFLCTPNELVSEEYGLLVGSVRPVVDCRPFPSIAATFQWSARPVVSDVLRNLSMTIDQFEHSRKGECLLLIQSVYKDLAARNVEEIRQELQSKSIINVVWTGNNFISPNSVYIDSHMFDVDLRPYMYQLPEEFRDLRSFFINIGCHNKLDANRLVDVLVLMQEKLKQGKRTAKENRKDLDLSIVILTHIAEQKDTIKDLQADDILIPVHACTKGDEDLFDLAPIGQCAYCESTWLREMNEDSEDIKYVHGRLQIQTAKDLGVRNLTQMLLSEAQTFEEWGQEESLTRRIKTLLEEGYVDGFSVQKELFQNADDAGATEVRFLYDERENIDARTRLLDEGMKECQGPALWVYNNAKFSDEDFENIQKLNAGTKMNDSTKIGKFGLGFCAVYNLTDVPSVISGNSIAIFDPHMTHLGKAIMGQKPGLKINLESIKTQSLVKRMQNQFKPFQGIFGCDIENTCRFEGTLFRLPLRTRTQALNSEIRKKEYGKKDCIDLLKIFVKNAGNLLIFSQHVSKVSLFHLPKDEQNPRNATCVYEVEKCVEMLLPTDNTPHSMLHFATNLKEANSLCSSPLQEFTRVDIRVELKDGSIFGYEPTESVARWLVSWATGTHQETIEMTTNESGRVPLGSVAMLTEETVDGHLYPIGISKAPFGFYSNGHVFTFLPLPIKTELDFHANGVFAITSDRKNLISRCEDAKDNTKCLWNKCIMSDAVCRAYLSLLEGLSKQKYGLCQEYVYHSHWPISNEFEELGFKQSFYKAIVEEQWKVFESKGRWYSLDQCKFLDPELQHTEEKIWTTAFDILSLLQSNKDPVLVNLPYDKVEEFLKTSPEYMKERIITMNEFLLNNFFPNISNSIFEKKREMRDVIIAYALTCARDEVKKKMKCTPCIPIDSWSCLRVPSDVVHPKVQISHLFSKDDCRFPAASPVDFTGEHCLQALEDLGMMTISISATLVRDRAQSIKRLAESCSKCSFTRCKFLLKYLSNNITDTDEIDLSDIAWLPALQKPSKWLAPWKADCLDGICSTRDNAYCEHKRNESETINLLLLGEPTDMFLHDVKDLVSCTELIVDKLLSRKYFEVLHSIGVKVAKQVETCSVVEQLKLIAHTFKDDVEGSDSLDAVCHTIYGFLNEHGHPNDFEDLVEMDIILVENKFIRPERVAYIVKHDCKPDLYEATRSLKRHSTLLQGLKVKEHISHDVIMRILANKKESFGNIPLPVKEIALTCNLLFVLANSLNEAGIQLMNTGQQEQTYEIYVPDSGGILRKTTEVCFDDALASEFDVNEDEFIFIHESFSKICAETLGVMTMTHTAFENNSVGFGQKEELVSRLNNLLQGYPCDSSIVKELLQNADDANATEIHLIVDNQKHSSEKEFSDSFKSLQGPALCVFNNSAFSQDDLDGIQRLGTGSKRNDPSKTGQYGVGFNVVYNLTDCPSFLTKGPREKYKETLCFFDPTRTHLPKLRKSEPGRRFLNLNKLRKTHPDVFCGYLEDQILNDYENGTMFRFPLRTHESPISRNIFSNGELDSLIDGIVADVSTMLLFLKNILKITISEISPDGELVQKYSVEATLSNTDREKRSSFFQNYRRVATQFKSNRQSICEQTLSEVEYQLNTEDSDGELTSWLVVQRLGYDKLCSMPQTLKTAVTVGDIGMLPHGGIALPLPKEIIQERETESNPNVMAMIVFCFLPLPIETGLPVQVHGHFALDYETRRNLWHGETGHRTEWNMFLLEQVIAPAYVTALNVSKLIMFQSSSEFDQHCISRRLKQFEGFFPLQKQATEIHWKTLATYVIQQIVDNKESLFPMLKSSETEQCIASGIKDMGASESTAIHWTALEVDGFQFSAYFKPSENDIDAKLMSVLQRFGMRIIHCTDKIKEAVEIAHRKATVLSPKEVTSFMRSYQSQYPDRVRIMKVDVQLNDTLFRSVQDIANVLKYCSSQDLSGLPLCLTNDCCLRVFQEISIICERECNLFPNSGHRFIHRDLVHILSGNSVVRSICMEDIVSILPDNLDTTLYGQGGPVTIKPTPGELPNAKWLQEFWHLVVRLSLQFPYRCTFQEHAMKFEAWCLLPADVNEDSLTLFPVCRATCLINLPSFSGNSRLYKVLLKLNMPQLMKMENQYHRAFQAIQSLLASRETPSRLLVSLHFHKPHISAVHLTMHECICILEYFSLALSQENEGDFSNSQLQSLPLYPTLHGSVTAVRNAQQVLVLPDSIPSDGIADWADQSQTQLLQDINSLSHLYKYLRFSSKGLVDFYCQYLFQHHSRFDISCLVVHIKNIMDNFGSYSDKDQTRLISALRHVPFIEVGNQRKEVSCFLSPRNAVFKTMCTSDKFPPNKFLTYEWHSFLVQLGLTTEVTGKMYVDFAKKIEKHSNHEKISERVLKMSKVVVKSLLTDSRESSLRNELDVLSKIKFVRPDKVDTKYSDLFRQKDNAELMICFSDAIPKRQFELSWTSMPVLFDEDSVPACSQFNVCQSPPLDKVVEHCQNIGDKIKNYLKTHTKSDGIDWIKTLMETVYLYMDEQSLSQDITQRRLKCSPFIYFPDERDILPARMVLIDCDKVQQIAPYLRKVPMYYGKFVTLFEKLGASKTASLNHYAEVINAIRQECGERKLLQPELVSVCLAIRNVLYLLKQFSNSVEAEGGELQLFLPARSKVLVDASSLVISDNRYIEDRIKDDKTLIYFLELPDNVLEGMNPSLLKRLPECWRPAILTDLIEEEIDLQGLDRYVSDLSRALDTFLHSWDFEHALLRLLKAIASVTKEQEEAMLHAFQGLSVWTVKRMYTFINLKGKDGGKRKIDGSEEDTECHIEKSAEGRYVIYISDITAEDPHFMLSKLTELVELLTDKCVEYKHILGVLQQFKNPERVESVLAKWKVPEYSHALRRAEMTFPPPGTYVPVELHEFLDNDMRAFEEFEYRHVVLEKEDPVMDADYSIEAAVAPRVFIYIHIKEELDDQRYRVDVGESVLKIVPSCMIYRFRRQRNTMTDVCISDNVPSTSAYFSLPLRVVFRQIRSCLRRCWSRSEIEKRMTIKRLYLRWHPDKNPEDKKEYCEKVFCFVRECIKKLERGEQLDDSDDEMSQTQYSASSSYPRHRRRATSDSWYTSSPYGQFFWRMDEGYRHFRWRNMSDFQSASMHQYSPVQDPKEARRWHRQAEADLSEAIRGSEEVEAASNWICYKCHQAVEKSLKAAWFARDANKVVRSWSEYGSSHDLCRIASGLGSDDLKRLATQVVEITGEHIKMRYPVDGQLPKDIYSKENADELIELSKLVLDHVSEEYIS